MKIILSPAKKMIPEDTVLYRGLPCFIEEAEYLRDLMKQMNREQLKELWKCSDKLVLENLERLGPEKRPFTCSPDLLRTCLPAYGTGRHDR